MLASSAGAVPIGTPIGPLTIDYDFKEVEVRSRAEISTKYVITLDFCVLINFGLCRPRTIYRNGLQLRTC